MLRINYQSLLLIGGLAIFAFLGLYGYINPLLTVGLLFAVLFGRIIQGLLQRNDSTPSSPTRHSNALLLHMIGAAVVSIGGMSLLGLPGIIPISAATPILAVFFGTRFLDNLPTYGGLGVIFLTNLIWPWTLAAAYLVAYRTYATASASTKVLIYAAIAYASAVLVTLGTYLFIRYAN